MLILNFSHPLRDEVVQAVEQHAGKAVEKVLEIPVYFDPDRGFVEQAREMLGEEKIPLTARQWQLEEILIVPPSHPVIALAAAAEIHARMGHFPTILRLKPEAGAIPTQYGFGEIIDLQRARDEERKT